MPRQSVSPWCNSVAFPASTTPLPCCLCVLCADHSHGAQGSAPRAGTRPTQLPCPQGLFVRSVYCHGLSDGTGRRAPAGGGRLCRFLKLLSVCEDRVCVCDGGSSHVLGCCYAGMCSHLFALPLHHRCRPLGPLAARRQGRRRKEDPSAAPDASKRSTGPSKRSTCPFNTQNTTIQRPSKPRNYVSSTKRDATKEGRGGWRATLGRRRRCCEMAATWLV